MGSEQSPTERTILEENLKDVPPGYVGAFENGTLLCFDLTQDELMQRIVNFNNRTIVFIAAPQSSEQAESSWSVENFQASHSFG